MGLFFEARKKKARSKQTVPASVLTAGGCKVCPLRRKDKVEPQGHKNPDVYILGHTPSSSDIAYGKHFAGDSASLVHPLVRPTSVRFGFIQKSAGEALAAVICCKKQVMEDIEKSKPKVIIGYGWKVLSWMLPTASNLDGYCGRRIPVTIGSHECWFIPTYEPSYLLKTRKKSKAGRMYPSKNEDTYKWNMQEALNFAKTCKPPKLVNANVSGIVSITGKKGRDFDKLHAQLKLLGAAPVVGVDIETTGLAPYNSDQKVLTIAISDGKTTVSFPVDHPKGWATEKLQKKVRKLLLQYLLLPQVKVCHNTAFELTWLMFKLGMNKPAVPDHWDDTMVYGYLLDERKGMLNLNTMCMEHLGFFLKQMTTVNAAAILDQNYNDVLVYNGLDAKYTALLHAVVKRKLPKTMKAAHARLLRATVMIAQVQNNGVPCCLEGLDSVRKEFTAKADKHEAAFFDCVETEKYKKKYGKDCSITAPKDVLRMFTDVMGFPLSSSDEASLESTNTEVGAAVIGHRKAQKILSTYVTGVADVIYDDGLLHPNYSLTRTATGRTSCERCNMQNWPKRKGKQVRRSIKVNDDEWLLSADYGQIEARVIGMAAKDRVFCKALWENFDIHLEWAEKIAYAFPRVVGGKKFLKDKKAMGGFRSKIKNTWVFPLFFGCQLYTAANGTGLTEEEAEPLFNEFWATFSDTKEWQESLYKEYKKNMYVETLTGRRRNGVLSLNEVVNTPIQGTASDIVVNAMCRISEETDYNIIMNIHDDITSRIHEDHIDAAIEDIATIMTNAPFDFINVPLAIEMEVGKDWANMESIGTFTTNQGWID